MSFAVLQSAFGLLAFVLIAWLLSENRRAVKMRLVVIGLALQFVLVLMLLKLAGYLRRTASLPPGSGGFAQYAGVGFTLRGGAVGDVTVNGRPLEAERVYTVVLDSYLAAGGDGYPRVDNRQGFVNTGFVDADVLREYIVRHSPLDPAAYAPTGTVRRE